MEITEEISQQGLVDVLSGWSMIVSFDESGNPMPGPCSSIPSSVVGPIS